MYTNTRYLLKRVCIHRSITGVSLSVEREIRISEVAKRWVITEHGEVHVTTAVNSFRPANLQSDLSTLQWEQVISIPDIMNHCL